METGLLGVERSPRDGHPAPGREAASPSQPGQTRDAASRPSLPGRSRRLPSGRLTRGRLRTGLRRHGWKWRVDLRLSRWKTWGRRSLRGCALSRFRRQSGNGPTGRAPLARDPIAPIQIGPGQSSQERTGREQTGAAQAVRRRADLHLAVRAQTVRQEAARVPRVLSAPKAGWRVPSPPAAANRAPVGHGPAASRAERADARTGREQDAAQEVVPARPSGLSGAMKAEQRAAVRRGLLRRAGKALRDCGRAARTRGRSARPARDGSRNRASAARASREGEAIPRPGRAGFQSPGPRANRVGPGRVGARRVGRAPSAADRGRAGNGPGASGLSGGRGFQFNVNMGLKMCRFM